MTCVHTQSAILVFNIFTMPPNPFFYLNYFHVGFPCQYHSSCLSIYDMMEAFQPSIKWKEHWVLHRLFSPKFGKETG